jgi:hypothetical protein
MRAKALALLDLQTEHDAVLHEAAARRGHDAEAVEHSRRPRRHHRFRERPQPPEHVADPMDRALDRHRSWRKTAAGLDQDRGDARLREPHEQRPLSNPGSIPSPPPSRCP